MKQAIILLSFICFGAVYGVQAQKIKSYNADELVARTAGNDTVYVVNFWATWCIPCVKELPSFNLVHDFYKGRPVKVILASFDFKEQYPQKLEAWVKGKKLRPEVVWFNETNPTEYIPKIAPEWEGGLPATLIINNKNGYKKLIAEEVTADQLKALIEEQLK